MDHVRKEAGVTVEDEARRTLVVARARRDATRLDYERAVVRASEAGLTQSKIATIVGVSQAAVSQLLASATKAPRVRRGRSGATPYEVCQRYAAGLLSREQVAGELSSWPYEQVDYATGGVDEFVVEGPDAPAHVLRAFEDGLIDEDLYLEVIS